MDLLDIARQALGAGKNIALRCGGSQWYSGMKPSKGSCDLILN